MSDTPQPEPKQLVLTEEVLWRTIEACTGEAVDESDTELMEAIDSCFHDTNDSFAVPQSDAYKDIAPFFIKTWIMGMKRMSEFNGQLNKSNALKDKGELSDNQEKTIFLMMLLAEKLDEHLRKAGVLSNLDNELSPKELLENHLSSWMLSMRMMKRGVYLGWRAAEVAQALRDEEEPLLAALKRKLIPTAEITLKRLPPLKVGDKVMRYLAGVPMPMVVLKVEPSLITCSGPEYHGADWTFDPTTGAEIDERFDWGPPPKATGSYITVEVTKEEV